MAAAEAANIGRVALMQEPVAAVMSVMRRRNQDSVFVIYDLGGGTLDIAVAESIAGRVNLLAHGGIDRHSVNGIPTGTTYTIAFGDDRNEAIVELRREEVFGNFVGKLAMAVGPRLLTELLRALMAGKEVRFAEAIIRDDGPTLVKHKFWGGNENAAVFSLAR
jgi:hypothetical protein